MSPPQTPASDPADPRPGDGNGQTSQDALIAMFPDLTPDQREVMQQLQARSAEIEEWFKADPSRVEALQSNPSATLSELGDSLGIILRAAAAADLPQVTILHNPLKCLCDPPRLLASVWAHIGQTEENMAAWTADRYQVIQHVAAATGASAQDQETVANAFRRLASGHADVVGPWALLNRLHGVTQSQLVIRPSANDS